MCELYVYEPKNTFTPDGAMLYRPVGIVDVWESLQWLEYYQDVGEVLLVCPYTASSRKILKAGNLLRYETDSAALIQQTELSETAGTATLTVRAETFTTVLDERLGENTTFLKTTSDLIAFLQKNHRYNGLERKVKTQGNLAIQPFFFETTWEPLLQVLRNICTDTGLGFGSQLASSGQDIYSQLVLCAGDDLTLPQSYKGYLGGTDDLEKLRIVEGQKGFKNVAVVAGKEKEGRRPMVTVSLGSVPAYRRREMFVDAADIAHTYTVNEPTGDKDAQGYPLYQAVEKEYPLGEYLNILRARGREELAKHLPHIEISAEAGGLHSPLVYGKDYQLGDIIPLRLQAYGLNLKARVAGVRLVEEVASGRYTNIILSDFEVM